MCWALVQKERTYFTVSNYGPVYFFQGYWLAFHSNYTCPVIFKVVLAKKGLWEEQFNTRCVISLCHGRDAGHSPYLTFESPGLCIMCPAEAESYGLYEPSFPLIFGNASNAEILGRQRTCLRKGKECLFLSCQICCMQNSVFSLYFDCFP